MKKKVCMFVWNHFTNDARVLRECTALSETEYDVDLICIHDPNDKEMLKYEEYNENFRIHRVRRYPLFFQLLSGVLRKVRGNKYLTALTLLSLFAGFYFIPLLTGIALAFVMGAWKFRKLWVAGSVFARMIIKGFSRNYDIYHSNDLNTLPQGYICSKFRLKKKTLIYDSHEVQTSRTGYDKPIFGKLESYLIKKMDSMIVENHTRATFNEQLYGFYPNVVYNYPFKPKEQNLHDIAPIRELLDLPADEKILLYQGGIQTGRGLDKLIEAAPLFKEGTLVLIGDGKIKEELQAKVKEMDLENKIKFISKVPLEDLPKYTRNAYLGFQVLNNVCFNHYSASSNKLFEYMSSGVPVVACEFPEIKKVVEGERTGICIDSHDYKQIAKAVNTLLTDKELHDEFSRNALIAREKYNWEVEKDNFLKVYGEQTGEWKE
ncbi:glycosyltransferase (plasmid) [Rossellomorea sp. AcN35-11]|nr:glycosyltransferase [Rossellomorea sp. AcN35-11]